MKDSGIFLNIVNTLGLVSSEVVFFTATGLIVLSVILNVVLCKYTVQKTSTARTWYVFVVAIIVLLCSVFALCFNKTNVRVIIVLILAVLTIGAIGYFVVHFVSLCDNVEDKRQRRFIRNLDAELNGNKAAKAYQTPSRSVENVASDTQGLEDGFDEDVSLPPTPFKNRNESVLKVKQRPSVIPPFPPPTPPTPPFVPQPPFVPPVPQPPNEIDDSVKQIDFSHVKNILDRLCSYDISQADMRQIREINSLVLRAENGEWNELIRQRINDGLGALLKMMSKYNV